MYAVIETGGKQYHVVPGEDVQVEKVSGKAGDAVSFDRVLMVHDGKKLHVGRPSLKGPKVAGRIIRQGKDKKIVVFKYKRRKGYRKKQGHRQPFTLVRIEGIEGL